MTKLISRTSLFISFVSLLFSCAKSNEGPQVTNPISPAFSIFLIDTNRIKVVDAEGKNEKLIAQSVQSSTKSTYISDMSASPDRKKIAYIVRKGTFPDLVIEVRSVDFDGANDKLITSINEPRAVPGNIKYGINGKIYYHYLHGTTTNFYVVNDDGTQNTKKIAYSFTDLTKDGRYLVLVNPEVGNLNHTRLQVLDLSGDGGAGSPVISKVIEAQVQSARITSDGKTVVAVSKAGTLVNAHIVDVATKTIETKVLLSSAEPNYTSLFISLAQSNDTGLLTVGGTVSKTYVFNVVAAQSTASFTNSSKHIASVYAF